VSGELEGDAVADGVNEAEEEALALRLLVNDRVAVLVAVGEHVAECVAVPELDLETLAVAEVVGEPLGVADCRERCITASTMAAFASKSTHASISPSTLARTYHRCGLRAASAERPGVAAAGRHGAGGAKRRAGRLQTHDATTR